jgi:hypothetical protein
MTMRVDYADDMTPGDIAETARRLAAARQGGQPMNRAYANPALAQGIDGHAHLTYYDHEHGLSFVWDGSKDGLDERWIDVAFGGYAEPVVMRIPWVIRLTGPVPSNVATDILVAFTTACVAFIGQLHDIEGLLDDACGRNPQ